MAAKLGTGLTIIPHGYEVNVFDRLTVIEDGKEKTLFEPVHIEDLFEHAD